LKVTLRRILVPTDFSAESAAALKYGIAFAEAFGGAIHLIHVIDVIAGAEPLAFQIGARQSVETAIETRAWDDLNGLLPADERKRLRAELALEWGAPFVEIVRYVKEHAIELIVMGTHGRGGVEHLLMGSVAENVVRTAPCPVLTVRHPEREFVRL
jgi:nucleotide-binding universal stress UspA family protein